MTINFISEEEFKALKNEMSHNDEWFVDMGPFHHVMPNTFNFIDGNGKLTDRDLAEKSLKAFEDQLKWLKDIELAKKANAWKSEIRFIKKLLAA